MFEILKGIGVVLFLIEEMTPPAVTDVKSNLLTLVS